jgi:prepilin-type N-terminal cleavage/methylation domain-containing protein
MLRHVSTPAARQAGFSLVELMIALVAGLIVSGAAVALVVSIMKSNADTIRATRLTQELRTTAEVISRELGRARGVQDPVANVGTPSANMVNECNTITATTSCIRYGYDCHADSAGVFDSGTFRSIGLVGTTIRMVNDATATAPPACPTTSTPTQLNSNSIQIESMVFTPTGASVTNNDYTLTIKGKFSNDPSATSPLERTIVQEVQVKSAAVQ